MKSLQNGTLVGLAALLAAGAAALLFAQSADPVPPQPPLPSAEDEDVLAWAEHPALQQQLGLNEAQTEQLRTIGREATKRRIRSRADWAVKRMELEELLEADKPDRAAVEKKLREIGDLHYAMLKSRVDTRLAVASVLTPEQRAKARTLVRQRLHARMRGFRGPRGARGGFGGPRPGPREFRFRRFLREQMPQPPAPPALPQPPAPPAQ